MASNPMQRQKKVSFLLGFLTMLVLSVIVIGFLGYTLFQMKLNEKARKAQMKEVCILTEDVQSGNSLDASVTIKKISGDAIPMNALTSAPLEMIAKINLTKGTVLTEEMISSKEEKLTNDIRTQEYNIASIPINIVTGDYIDVRIRFPSGLDYIIVSKKEITIPEIAGAPSADTFFLNMSEVETNVMSCAIVEAYRLPGTEIYINKFIEPGMQEASLGSYIPTQEVNQLIANSPNIVEEAKSEFYKRYYKPNSRDENGNRNNIQSELDQVDEDEANQNVQSGIQEHITRQKQHRQEYLQDLSGV